MSKNQHVRKDVGQAFLIQSSQRVQVLKYKKFQKNIPPENF